MEKDDGRSRHRPHWEDSTISQPRESATVTPWTPGVVGANFWRPRASFIGGRRSRSRDRNAWTQGARGRETGRDDRTCQGLSVTPFSDDQDIFHYDSVPDSTTPSERQCSGHFIHIEGLAVYDFKYITKKTPFPSLLNSKPSRHLQPFDPTPPSPHADQPKANTNVSPRVPSVTPTALECRCMADAHHKHRKFQPSQSSPAQRAQPQSRSMLSARALLGVRKTYLWQAHSGTNWIVLGLDC